MNEWGTRRRFNWLLLVTLIGIGGLGLINLSSAGRGTGTNLALVQGIWFGFSLMVALVLMVIDYRLFDRLAYPLFLAGVLSLLAVLAVGKVVNNSRRWLDLGFMNLQPSEVMKIGIILAVAKYFSDDADQTRPRSMASRILIRLHPVYPVVLAGGLSLYWNHPQLFDLGSYRWLLIGLCICWEALAVWLELSRGRRTGGGGPLEPSSKRGYSLDDLIKPATPLYALGAAGALILFWEREPLALLGGWRFLLLGTCFIWAAVSTMFAFRTGRTSLHDLLSPVILMVVPALLIMRQPDLGTALVLLVTGASMILFSKIRLGSFIIAALVLVVAIAASWSLLLKPYQQDRIKAFLDPAADTKNTAYHSRQSIIAVGSGRMSGKGYGNSTQTQFRFLPEQHTDFVFSVWAEEQGFTGSLVVLMLFLFLLVQVVNVASSARERFGLLLCIGLASLTFWHVFINIGMISGVLPVVGLTLPLWSYGGSSVLAFLVGFGLVLSVSFNRRVY